MAEISVSDAAFAQIGQILAQETDHTALRVAVLGGGCSGFQYKFELEKEIAEDDMILEKDGIRVLIDPVSIPFLEGSVIDYQDDLIGARFAVQNPNATSGCGCGTSFSI